MSFLLVFIFLSPTLIQFTDGLFHHHEHFYHTTNGRQQIHHHHEKCPIPGFEFSLYEATKVVVEFETSLFCCTSFAVPESGNYYIYRDYSFLLRAPPAKSIFI